MTLTIIKGESVIIIPDYPDWALRDDFLEYGEEEKVEDYVKYDL